jgi:L-iditol 2-dehydrogenase
MKMKAALKAEPKPGITVTTVPVPTCGSDDIILRIGAAGICGSDLHLYRWDETGQGMARKLPVIIGHEFMGEIVEVGDRVKGFSVGERVAVDPGITCGVCRGCRTGQPNLCENREVLGAQLNGGFAQYTLVAPDCLYKLPDEVTDAMGAFLEIFALGVHAVEKSSLKPGDTVVVIGAGPIGLSILLCAQTAGARKTYVTEKHFPSRLGAAKAYGPDAVIDVDEVDPVETILNINHGQKADVVFEVSGNPVAVRQAADLARKGGEIIVVGVPPENRVEIPLLTLIDNEISLIPIRGRRHTSWVRAISLIDKLNVSPIIGTEVKLDDIDEGFKKVINREAIKVIVKPN